MGTIDTYFAQNKLTRIYNSAKMEASITKYTLSDKLLFKHNAAKYSIFVKTHNSEDELCRALELENDQLYLGLRKDLNISETIVDNGNLYSIDSIYSNDTGFFLKYNDLLVNENELDFIKTTKMLFGEVSEKVFYTLFLSKDYLKSLLVLFSRLIDENSLVPNLMYLVTNVHDNSLSYLNDLEFVKDTITKKKAPVLRSFGEFFNKASGLFSNSLLSNNYSYDKPSTTEPLELECLKLSRFLTVVYGCEILYQLSKISDTVTQDILMDLFMKDYPTTGSFIKDYLYEVEPDFLINKELKDCFDDNPIKRFTNFKEYFNKKVSLIAATAIKGNELYWHIPAFFRAFSTSCHQYAYQESRIRHALYLYKFAKNTGVLNPEDYKEVVSAAESGVSIPTDTSGGDSSDTELFNLQEFNYNDPKDPSLNEDLTTNSSKSKSVAKLNVADAIMNDLHKSMYDFDIKNRTAQDTSLRHSYLEISNSIKLISDNLSKSIRNIKTYNTGGKVSGCTSGKLDSKNLYQYKTSNKIFCKNNYKLKEMDLAFGCILDQSGSMRGEGVKNGRIAMILLHEVLNSLGINHSIVGHESCGMHQCTIRKYYAFKEDPAHSLKVPYQLAGLDAYGGNCDSGSLYYMETAISHVQNKDKIVLIFSDGQPTECTDKELRDQVKRMERKGIHVIGIGINYEAIEDYYSDYANGRNLKEMITIISSILNRYVLEKKD